MEFIVVILILFAVASAHLHSLSSRTFYRPTIGKSRSIGPFWGPQNVVHPPNLYPSIDIPQPSSPQDFGMYAKPMEDEKQAAQDIALYLTNKFDQTENSLGWSPISIQNNQLPYPVGYINPKYFYQPPYSPGYAPNGLPDVPTQGMLSPFPYHQSAGREGEDVPKWTSFEITNQKMTVILRTNMISPETTNHERISEDNWQNERALYTLLIGVVLELMDKVAKGKNQYDEFFDSYLPHIHTYIKEKPSVTPHKLAKGIWDRMMDIDDGNSMVRSYIGFMNNSIYCNNSLQCDKVIDDVLKTTTNKRLQEEAKLLQAQFKFAEVFLSNYAAEFETKAANLAVSGYLGDIDNNNLKTKLKPLILAGAELIKRREEIGPLQPLDLTVFPELKT